MEIKAISVKRTDASWMEVGLLALIVLMHEIPIIPKILGGNPTVIPFMFLFIMIGLFKRPVVLKSNIFSFLIAYIIFAAFQVLYKITGVSTTGIGMYVNMVAFFFFFLVLFPLMERTDMKQKVFLFGVTLFAILFTILENTIMYIRYGFVYFTAIAEKDASLSNATNTAYSTAIVIFCGWVLIAILHDRVRRNLWILLFCVLNAFNLFIAQRAITLLLSVLMYVLIIVFSSKQTVWVFVLMIAGAFAVLLLYLNSSAVLTFARAHIGSERIAYKLLQIQKALEAGDIARGGGSLSARYKLYMLSLRTWLSSPKTFLVGIGEHWDSNKQIGNHSQFLDVLAQYGLVGAVFFYFCVYKSMAVLFSYYLPYKKEPLFKQMLIVCCVCMIRGAIGHIMYGTVGIQFFVVFPIIMSMISERELIHNGSINLRVWLNRI